MEINHKYPNCPARTTSEYGISCAVQLRCKEGGDTVIKERRLGFRILPGGEGVDHPGTVLWQPGRQPELLVVVRAAPEGADFRL